MRFDPKEADANLLPEAWYDAIVMDAIDTVSKKGNDMMTVTFKIYDDRGLQPLIDRYFVKSQAGLSGLKKLCRAVGVAEEVFQGGEVDPMDLRGKPLRVLVKIQKDETGRYDDKNVAAAFEPKTNAASTSRKSVV